MTQAKSPTLSYRLCYNLPWVVTPKIELNTKQTVVKTEHFTAVFLYPFLGSTWLNGKQKPHQSGAILSQRWWAVHSHCQIQSIRHEKHVSLFTQSWMCHRYHWWWQTWLFSDRRSYPVPFRHTTWFLEAPEYQMVKVWHHRKSKSILQFCQ